MLTFFEMASLLTQSQMQNLPPSTNNGDSYGWVVFEAKVPDPHASIFLLLLDIS
jgi:hypothetical protein